MCWIERERKVGEIQKKEKKDEEHLIFRRCLVGDFRALPPSKLAADSRVLAELLQNTRRHGDKRRKSAPSGCSSLNERERAAILGERS